MMPTSPRLGSHPQARNACSSSGRSFSTVNGWHTYAVLLWLPRCENPHQQSTSGLKPMVARPQSAHLKTGLPPGVIPAPVTQRKIRPPHALQRWSSSAQVCLSRIFFLRFFRLRSNKSINGDRLRRRVISSVRCFDQSVHPVHSMPSSTAAAACPKASACAAVKASICA